MTNNARCFKLLQKMCSPSSSCMCEIMVLLCVLFYICPSTFFYNFYFISVCITEKFLYTEGKWQSHLHLHFFLYFSYSFGVVLIYLYTKIRPEKAFYVTSTCFTFVHFFLLYLVMVAFSPSLHYCKQY